MGNECAYGCTFEAALKWTKEFDPTRLTHYESARYVDDPKKYDYSNLDLYSRMYPSLEEIKKELVEYGDKPYIMCEYCHAMGNGPGDLEDYFELIHSEEKMCGGFIWEWCDHAIDMGKTIEGKKMYAYGGDHNEYPHDGNFCMDGLVYPDRTPHTGLMEFKNVYRPVRVTGYDAEKGTLTIKNYMNFVNLKDYAVLGYEVLVDGEVTESGKITDEALLELAAGCEKTIPLAISVPEQGKCALKVTWYQKQATEVLPEQFELGFEEVPVKTKDNQNQKAKEMMKRPEGTVSFGWKEDDHYLTVSTEQFSYTYNKFTGLFEKMCYANQNLLDRPMELNIWRAPTDNDRNIKNTWMRAQYDRTVTRAYETTAKEENGCVEIETSYSISSPALQRILAGVIKWTIYSDGTTDVHVEAKKDPVFPVLPRFGLRLFLPESFAKLTYCGLGPVESYVDKHQASYHGVFHSTPAEQQEDYIRPQENGSHYDCDYASLASDRAVLTAVGEKTFSFQASIYTQEELTAKAHNYELRPCGSTVFCIDYRQAGIGSASCGPMLLEKYQLKETEIIGYNEVVSKSLDLIRDITPLPSWMNGISSYSIWWLLIQRDWYYYQGNLAYLQEQRSYMTALLRHLISKVDPSGQERLDGNRFLDWPSSENTPAIDAGLQSLMIQAMRAGEELCTVLGEDALASECRMVASKAIEFSLRKKSRFPSEKDRITPGDKQAAALMALAGIMDAKEANERCLAVD